MPTERQTRQRSAIRDALHNSGRPLSPKEILEHAQKSVSGLGLATVYRALRALAEAGLVKVVEIPGESPRYEVTGKGHHHHFCCRVCGKVYEIDGCCGHYHDDVPAGFEVEGHEVVIFGRCASCAQRRSN
ncbi:MAG: Fur family transcriptional regulator [Phycisphaerales bacterium]